MKVNITKTIIEVLRQAADTKSCSDLEAVPPDRLREVLQKIVDAYEEAVARAAKRKRARRFSAAEDERLRHGFAIERRPVHELARLHGRTPRAIVNRLITIGPFTPGDIGYCDQTKLAPLPTADSERTLAGSDGNGSGPSRSSNQQNAASFRPMT